MYHTPPAELAKTLYGAYGNSCILQNSLDSTIVRLFTTLFLQIHVLIDMLQRWKCMLCAATPSTRRP